MPDIHIRNNLRKIRIRCHRDLAGRIPRDGIIDKGLRGGACHALAFAAETRIRAGKIQCAEAGRSTVLKSRYASHDREGNRHVGRGSNKDPPRQLGQL